MAMGLNSDRNEVSNIKTFEIRAKAANNQVHCITVLSFSLYLVTERHVTRNVLLSTREVSGFSSN